MNDDDTIKDLLDSTAPDGPELPSGARTTAVRARARAVRRRNGLVLAAAVVAVVGIGTGVAVVSSGDDPTPQDQVAADPSPSEPAAPVPPECPAEPAVIDQDGKASRATFPPGASSLRFCPATFDTQSGTTELTLPTEPLTEGVDEVLAEVAAQPAWTFPDECAAMMLAPMPWTLVVAYPDGSTVSVGATLTGCASVTIGGKEVDVEPTLDLLSSAILASAGGPASAPTGR